MASILTTALTAIAGPLVVATVFYYVLFGALLRLVGAHLRSRTAGKREAITRLKGDKAKIVGFFHPYWYHTSEILISCPQLIPLSSQ